MKEIYLLVTTRYRQDNTNALITHPGLNQLIWSETVSSYKLNNYFNVW